MFKRLTPFITLALIGGPAFADGKLCELIVAGPEAIMSELVNLSTAGDKGAAYKELFKAYQKATDLSKADVTEAINLQTQMAHTSVSTKRPGEGPASDVDKEEAAAAYQYAKDNSLGIQAAFMRAIKNADEAVVRGFLIISRQLNSICQDVPGYPRFCKDLDLDKGWSGEEFFLEAAQASLEVALLLAAEKMNVSLEKLDGLIFGTPMAVKFVEEGADFSFAKAIPMKDEDVALSMIKRGDAFTPENLQSALGHRKKVIIKAALEKYPQLASAVTGGGAFPLATAAALDLPEIVDLLLKTYKVDVNQKTNSQPEAVVYSVGLDDTKVFYLLLEAGADLTVQTQPGWGLLSQAALHSSYRPAGVEYVRELILAGVEVRTKHIGTLTFAATANRAEYISGGEWTPFSIADKKYALGSTNYENVYSSAIRKILEENGAR